MYKKLTENKGKGIPEEGGVRIAGGDLSGGHLAREHSSQRERPKGITVLFGDTMVGSADISMKRETSQPVPESPRKLSEGIDLELFRRFIDGEEDVMMEIFDRHHHQIYLYCLKMLGSKEAAEDVAQEHWLRLIRYLRKGKKVSSPVALMLTIARNLCMNHLRISRPHVPIDDILDSEHPVVVPQEFSHLEELVVLSLPKLPFRQREVLILHAYCGFRFEDIAVMLGEPVGTVRMRASRARAHLGRILSAIIGMEEDKERNNSRKRDEGDRG